MSNTLLTTSMITREAARVLSNNLVLAKTVNRDYDSEFAIAGAKIGQTLNVRKPVRPTTSQGPVANIQGANESYAPLTFTDPYNVSYAFTSQEMQFSIDDFSERFIKPAMVALANKIDAVGYAAIMNKVYNQVGTPGTPLTEATARAQVLQAAATLYNNDAPVDSGDLHCINTPAFNAILSGSNAALFNPQREISENYVKGLQGEFGGFKHYLSQNVPSLTLGAYGGTPEAVSVTPQTGSSIVTGGWTPTTTVLKAGTVITFDGVYMVNPQTKLDLGILQQFVILEDVTADGAGAATLTVSPAIVTTGGTQNVTNGVADTAAINVVSGASGTSHAYSLAFHRDAIMCANKDLPLPAGVAMADYVKDPMSGIGIRVVQQYDVRNDQFITRFDTQVAWAPLYEQLAVRIATN
jgi:hypothetical protein